MTSTDAPSTPATHAVRVIDITAKAWRIAPQSAHANTRRAPHGWVPFRSLRRIRHTAGEGLAQPRILAHTS